MHALIPWAAGLFEGEGSIFFYRNTPTSMSWRMKLKMTDQDVMQHFFETVDCGKLYYEPNKNHKPAWNWVCYRIADVKKLLLAFLPFLGQRRTYKAQNALDYYDNCYNCERPVSRK